MSLLLAKAMGMFLREDHGIFKAVMPLESRKVEISTLFVSKLKGYLNTV